MKFSIDQRWGRRKITDASVRFMALPGTLGVGRITNVSVTGAFLQTNLSLPCATVVHVEGIDAHGHGARKRLSGTVVRSTEQGVGLEWCECASNSALYAQFGSAYRDRVDFLQPAVRDDARTNFYYFQFDFKE